MGDITPLRRVEPTRTCTGCGERKPWSQFGPHTRWPDGSIRAPRSRCKTCEAKRRRDERATDPVAAERMREACRRWKAKVRAEDPEGWREAEAARNAKRRERRGGKPAGPSVVDREDSGYVPLAPFRGWLETFVKGECDDNLTVAAERLDTNARSLFAWLRERDVIRVDTVDAALCAYGDPFLLGELYPELYAFDVAA